jgi:ATP-dependent Clp protease ATP-binding subunit ClpA
MKPNFDSACQNAIDLAKGSLPEGASLDVEHLMAAVYHATDIKGRLPQVAIYLPLPQPVKQPRDKVPVAESLKPVLGRLAKDGQPVTAEKLFSALVGCAPGRQALNARGLRDADLQTWLDSLEAGARWRQSPERDAAMRTLSPYGRMLTAIELPQRGTAKMDKPMGALVRTLSKMRRRNAIVVGPPGTGKSALIYELARRLTHGDESIPDHLRDADLFELSPAFLASGAARVGDYEARVKSLLEVLQANPKIILFVDEVHSFFQSSMHHQGWRSDANESFKGALAKGDITCIGCTTDAEYRAYIAPDKALERRFNIIHMEPPSRDDTIAILRSRIPKMEEYFAPLRISEPILPLVVDLTDEHLPSRYQPDKSIQLLDEACAVCRTSRPPAKEVAEPHVIQALEDLIGHGLVRNRQVTEAEVYDELRQAIVGQYALLREVARKFVAGLQSWDRRTAPRAVFLFGGPTGVGKTETARALARILGGGREHMVRIDCANLQGSGTGHDSRALTWQLLGPAPGHVGFVHGQCGLLGKVRDMPESVVLFDEFEKADRTLGQLLLPILDEGRTQDTEGNLLDFHRAFIIFTTNAGCSYEHRSFGFDRANPSAPDRPAVEQESLQAHLRAIGLGEEFLARIQHWFLFQGLDAASIREIVQQQLQRLRQTVQGRGLRLEWDAELLDHLADQWQPRFGVRHLTTILTNRIVEQLSVAAAQDELEGVSEIRLRLLRIEGGDRSRSLTGIATRERLQHTLLIHLA